jgi:hypothetical protein
MTSAVGPLRVIAPTAGRSKLGTPPPPRASSPARAAGGCAAGRRPLEVENAKKSNIFEMLTKPTFLKNIVTFVKNVGRIQKKRKTFLKNDVTFYKMLTKNS